MLRSRRVDESGREDRIAFYPGDLEGPADQLFERPGAWIEAAVTDAVDLGGGPVMQRTVLGLFTSAPEDELESQHGDLASLQVTDVQETVDGRRVYAGEAARIGTEERDVPTIGADGEIEEVTQNVQTRTHCDWFAVLDADPAFVAVDSSDADFVFRQIGLITGGHVQEAVYSVDWVQDHIESRGASIWQVLWSNTDEAGSLYPGPDTDEDVIKRGLRSDLSQLGFTVQYDGQLLRGTIASSGYCELYKPDWGFVEMAQWIESELLQHSGVEDVGTAEKIAAGQVEFDPSEHESASETDTSGEEDATDEEQPTLGDLDTVGVAGGADE